MCLFSSLPYLPVFPYAFIYHLSFFFTVLLQDFVHSPRYRFRETTSSNDDSVLDSSTAFPKIFLIFSATTGTNCFLMYCLISLVCVSGYRLILTLVAIVIFSHSYSNYSLPYVCLTPLLLTRFVYYDYTF